MNLGKENETLEFKKQQVNLGMLWMIFVPY